MAVTKRTSPFYLSEAGLLNALRVSSKSLFTYTEELSLCKKCF